VVTAVCTALYSVLSLCNHLNHHHYATDLDGKDHTERSKETTGRSYSFKQPDTSSADRAVELEIMTSTQTILGTTLCRKEANSYSSIFIFFLCAFLRLLQHIAIVTSGRDTHIISFLSLLIHQLTSNSNKKIQKCNISDSALINDNTVHNVCDNCETEIARFECLHDRYNEMKSINKLIIIK